MVWPSLISVSVTPAPYFLSALRAYPQLSAAAIRNNTGVVGLILLSVGVNPSIPADAGTRGTGCVDPVPVGQPDPGAEIDPACGRSRYVPRAERRSFRHRRDRPARTRRDG